jgi:spoIIIJ-associated protein
MDNAKEFAGKTLDEAILEACAYFDLPREKLEIDIVSDAKSGIFGLVGTRKAIVRARQAQVTSKVGDIFTPRAPRPRAPLPDAQDACEETVAPGNAARIPPAGDHKPAHGNAEHEQPYTPQDGNEADRRVRRKFETQPASPDQEDDEDFNTGHEPGKPDIPYTSLDQDALRSAVYDTACRLIRPIVPDAELVVEIGAGRVAVYIDSHEDLGLLIGREGQTLASIQYLAARIVARKLGVPVRLQFDAGDYRERQDGKLRSLALMLADRVKAAGRTCTTRPLTSYQRRIVHMTLQDDASVLTRSSGEGPLKRVVIQRSRAN